MNQPTKPERTAAWSPPIPARIIPPITTMASNCSGAQLDCAWLDCSRLLLVLSPAVMLSLALGSAAAGERLDAVRQGSENPLAVSALG